MTESYLDMMAESLDKKLAIMRQIEEENMKQKELFEAGASIEDGSFDATVDRKGALIDQLEALNEGFAKLFENVKAQIGDNRERYAAQIRLMQEKIRAVTEMSNTLQTQEARNKQLADKFFSDHRSKIKEGQKSSNAALKYYQGMNRSAGVQTVQPQFFDSKK